jgi:threonine dehydratase
MAGNGTIGLEILEDLPDPDAVVIPYGGGGLTVGIASAVRALRPARRSSPPSPRPAPRWPPRSPPGTRPTSTTALRSSTAPAAGACSDSMWPLVAPLVDGALAIPVAEAAAAVRLLAERARVIAEGAGALAPAAALAGRAGTGRSSASSPAATST